MGFSTDPTKGSCFMLMESMSNSLIRNMRMRKLVEAVVWALGVLLLFLFSQSRYWSSCWVNGLPVLLPYS